MIDLWKERWTGCNVYPVTVFTPDLEVDYDAMRSLFRFLIKGGVSGMSVCGHTGEGETLTLEEQKKIIKIAQEEVKGKVPICVGLHAHTTEQAIEMAKELEKTGVDAVMPLAPGFYLMDVRENPKPGIEYHKAVAKAVNLPMMFHQVYGTIDEYPVEAIQQIFREAENYVGVKLANGYNTRWFKIEADMRALRAIGRHNIALLPGTALASLWLWGADGTFTGYLNFDCERIVTLFNETRKEEIDIQKVRRLATDIHEMEAVMYVNPMVDLITRYKIACAAVGTIPRADVRPPKVALGDAEVKRIREACKKSGLIKSAERQAA